MLVPASPHSETIGTLSVGRYREPGRGIGFLGPALLIRVSGWPPGRSQAKVYSRVVFDLGIDDFSRQRIDASVAKLIDERDSVRALGLLG